MIVNTYVGDFEKSAATPMFYIINEEIYQIQKYIVTNREEIMWQHS